MAFLSEAEVEQALLDQPADLGYATTSDVIAHELLVSLRANVSVDWAHRDSARAKLRVLVKRILRKYGYPPDLQDTAVQTVLRQAEELSAVWSLSEPTEHPHEHNLTRQRQT